MLRAGLPPTNPGFIMLHTLKIAHTKLGDSGLISLLKASPLLQHLELNRCEVSEASLKYLIKEAP
jgi:hypothetical protein